jgi:hypothetical protein
MEKRRREAMLSVTINAEFQRLCRIEGRAGKRAEPGDEDAEFVAHVTSRVVGNLNLRGREAIKPSS